MEMEAQMPTLLLVPLEDVVVFPHMSVTLPVDVGEIPDHRGDDGRIAAFLRSISDRGALADTAGYSPDLSFEQKVELLETLDVTERLELALSYQKERLAELQIRQRIREDVQSGAEKQQREYILRKQMESIRKELGEDEGSVIEDYRAKIAET